MEVKAWPPSTATGMWVVAPSETEVVPSDPPDWVPALRHPCIEGIGGCSYHMHAPTPGMAWMPRLACMAAAALAGRCARQMRPLMRGIHPPVNSGQHMPVLTPTVGLAAGETTGHQLGGRKRGEYEAAGDRHGHANRSVGIR